MLLQSWTISQTPWQKSSLLLVVVLADRQMDDLVVVVTSLPTGVHSIVVVILARMILVATFKELFTM